MLGTEGTKAAKPRSTDALVRRDAFYLTTELTEARCLAQRAQRRRSRGVRTLCLGACFLFNHRVNGGATLGTERTEAAKPRWDDAFKGNSASTFK